MRARNPLGIGFAVILGASGLALGQDAPAAGSIDATIGGRAPATRPKPRLLAPKTYGTTVTSYYVIDSSEFSPVTSGVAYSGINNFQLRYRTDSAGLGMWAPMHLPAGALVTYLEIDYYDNSAVGEVQASFGVCDYAGQGCVFQPGNPGCGDAPVTICSGNTDVPGYSNTSTDLSGDGIVIDNFNNRYTIAVGNTTTDGSTAWSQIIVGYLLQVSPAPGSATFPDVPTSDFGFQYVEALVASGITGGCGGGNYCPDAPVTRRQMAIFIAKALGLQWH